LLQKTITAASSALTNASALKLFFARSNEAGSQMGSSGSAGLKDAGLNARVPFTTASEAQTVGYLRVRWRGYLE
jgi:hypothetical protein